MQQNFLSISKSSIMKQFFVIYGVLIALMGALILGWYWYSVAQEYKTLKQKEHLLLHVHQKAMMEEYQSVLSDMINLAALPVHLDQNSSSLLSKHIKNELAKTYLSYAKTRGRYDQIRLLANNGQELVRVNHYDGESKVVPRSELQDKSDRYYFKTLSKMSPSEIYISRLDLNVEHGQVEEPPKPMIRIGMGVYDQSGQRYGMVVLNYLASWLLGSLEDSHRAYEQLSYLFLLDQDGYWLKGPNADSEFGFMYPDKQETSFAHLHQAMWQKIQRQKEGQVLTDAGLYSFKTFNPLDPKFTQLKGRYRFGDKRFVSDNNQRYAWVMLSFVPKADFSRQTDEQIAHSFPYIAIVMTAMAFLAFILAGYRVDQAFLRNKIKYMAYHDELTGLLNRHSLTSEEGKIFFKQTEDQMPYAVFFLDLDGFKPINDQYGHHFGDEVLKVVAKRLSHHVREGDIVVRIGGDEFAVIACDALTKDAAKGFADKLIEVISEPMHIEGNPLQVGTSIGIALCPANGDEINQLIDAADIAMYQAKNAGKGKSYFA